VPWRRCPRSLRSAAQRLGHGKKDNEPLVWSSMACLCILKNFPRCDARCACNLPRVRRLRRSAHRVSHAAPPPSVQEIDGLKSLWLESWSRSSGPRDGSSGERSNLPTLRTCFHFRALPATSSKSSANKRRHELQRRWWTLAGWLDKDAARLGRVLPQAVCRRVRRASATVLPHPTPARGDFSALR
jgi:hypothetical protein